MTDLPDIKFKTLVSFPSKILDGIGIDTVKMNGSYQFNLAYDDFAPPVTGLLDPSHQNALLWNNITGTYTLANIALLGGSSGIPDAPVDGIIYGRKNAAWALVPTGNFQTVADFGAKGDGKYITTLVSIASSSSALTAPSAAFTAADIGKSIVVPGAGPSGAELITTIATFTDATHIGLTATASTALSAVSKTLFYGTDNTTFINNAITATNFAFVPVGNFAISGTILLSTAGHYLIGTGTNSSIITSISKTLPAIRSGSNVQDWGVKHMTVTRAVIAIAGAHGIYQPATADAGFIDDVTVTKHYVGISLTNTGYSRLTHSQATANVSHGIQFIPSTDGNLITYQWNLDDIICQINGGEGIHADTIGAASGVASMGNWLHYSAFGNTGPALHAVGTSLASIANIRVTGMFVGQDGGAAEVILDTYSAQGLTHSFTDCELELATGGFYISANNGPVSITNAWICNMTGTGVITQGLQTSINGGYFTACVNGVTPYGRLLLTDCTISQNTNVGIAFQAGSGPHLIVNNDFTLGSANTNGAFNGLSGIATGSKILNNIGYNPIGMHTISVGASPFTYTAGPSGENVFISGGTVAAINVSGSSAFGPVTNLTIPLEPNGNLTIAYSVAPTMTGMQR